MCVLTVVPGLTLEGRKITSGTQVSTQLTVAANVITAPEDTLPDWAKTGQETLDNPDTKFTELNRLYALAVERRKAILNDEILGSLDETGGKLLFPVP